MSAPEIKKKLKKMIEQKESVRFLGRLALPRSCSLQGLPHPITLHAAHANAIFAKQRPTTIK